MKFLGAAILLLSTLSFADGWVKAEGDHFTVNGTRLAFLSANMWYGATLGALDKPRLRRELDSLHRLGVRNVRIMAASEGPDSEPWRVSPSLQPSPGIYNENIFTGLDFFLDEMSKRHMYAVLCLGNFWHWSGGFSQYVAWNGDGPIPYPLRKESGDWEQYKRYAESFYTNLGAKADYLRFVRKTVSRVNSITGVSYLSDPTIMTWELANEPTTDKQETLEAYAEWIRSTARMIKQMDPNHLVISGSEEPYFKEINGLKDIDYATIHVWAQNSGWYNPKKPLRTYPASLRNAHEKLKMYSDVMQVLHKPLVVAEIGLARDLGSYSVESSTTFRDHYYNDVMTRALMLNVAGVAFWAWSGEGRPPVEGGRWQVSDPLLGDPAHEPQGWYGVYDVDASTLKTIREFSDRWHLN